MRQPVGLLLLLIAAAFNGCSKREDVKTQTSELEKAFPAATTAEPVPVEAQTMASQAPANADAYVKAALTAVRADDYAGGVIALQTAQSARGVSAKQLMAIEQTKRAMTADLMRRADAGDAKAKADLARIEKTMSQ
jgi:hypothetical protein